MHQAASLLGTASAPAYKVSGDAKPTLTNAEGHPQADVAHSFNIAGHPLVSDNNIMEKQQAFNRNKIVERMVHPSGCGALGYFKVTKDVSKFTKAKFLSTVGKQTDIFVRFSTVTVGREFPDSCRNPRGFAIKFYTEEGNYDLVGLNFPVFFVRDPALGPDVIKSQQRNPQNFLIDYNSWFDFTSLVPESLHAYTMMFSDYGHPYGYRMMNGYGAHTFKWVNAAGEQFYIKYHFEPEAGIKNFTWEEAVKMCGEDPDFAKRDLFEHLNGGKEAVWKAFFQIMPLADADKQKFDPFDVTKVWPKKEFPLNEFGTLVLNKNPINYHRDVEQVAFSPGSFVPGIEASPDALLQFRTWFYRDTQYYRLGVNLHQIPVNCPWGQQNYHPFNRDGAMRVDTNGAGEPSYMPNSRQGMPTVNPDYRQSPVKMPADVAARYGYSKHENNFDDDYKQCRDLVFEVMTESERKNLYHNNAKALKFVDRDICLRYLVGLYRVDPTYAKGVIDQMEETPKGRVTMQDVETLNKTFKIDRENGYKFTQ